VGLVVFQWAHHCTLRVGAISSMGGRGCWRFARLTAAGWGMTLGHFRGALRRQAATTTTALVTQSSGGRDSRNCTTKLFDGRCNANLARRPNVGNSFALPQGDCYYDTTL
jgi:hypothetical protein